MKCCKQRSQRGFGLNYFKGQSYQKGYGLGGFFRKFFKWASPYISKIMPIIKQGAKHVGKEVIDSAANIAKDVLEGKDLKESSSTRINDSIDNLVSNKPMTGSGYKRKRKYTNSFHFKKRKQDIFDKK